MNMIIQRFNQAHDTNNSYRSPIADTFSNQSTLERYIRARLTNRQTVRILLDQKHLQEEQEAIAKEIARRTVDIIKTL